MTEAWVAVVFAVVIVLGMSITRIWEAVLSTGAPLVETLLARTDTRGEAGGEVERITDLDRRVERLDERIEFLEELLERRSASAGEPVGGSTSKALGDPES